MAAGDIYIRSNSTDNTTSLPNGEVKVDLEWDTVSTNQGTAATYSNGVFSLSAGKYLVIHSEKFGTTETTNNDRFELQGELIVTGAQGNGGFCQDFIRKQSSQQDVSMGGAMIVNVASAATVKSRFYRSDNSVLGLCNRVPNFGSVTILQLDATESIAQYRATASQHLTSTESVIAFNSNLTQDLGFTRVGNAITIADAGRYYITYSLQCSQTTTGREDVVGRLTNNGTEIVASQSFSYVRGGDGCQDGALSWQGIVDLPALSSIELKCAIPQSATFLVPANNPTIHFWKIPSAGDVAILEATSGDYNASALFTFDTVGYIDSSRFSATSNSPDITLDGEADFCMVISTFHQDSPDSPQRAYPEVKVQVDGVTSSTASAGVYHRNSGGSGVVAVTVSDIVSVEQNKSINILTAPTATNGSLNADQAAFSVLSLTSLYGAYAIPPAVISIDDTSISIIQTGVTVTGARFGSTQGSGQVVISNTTDPLLGVSQTVTSWSDTQITFDTNNLDTLVEGQAFISVLDNAGSYSNSLQISVGLPSYFSIVRDTEPDHWWILDGDYNDTVGNNTMNVSTTGTHTFTANPLVDLASQSWRSQNGKRETASSTNMNLQVELTRTMGGWIMLNGIQAQVSCLYEEGGSVNNLAYFVGVGNVLVCQLADTGDDNVQAFSDFSLEVDRAYHVMFKFDYNLVGSAKRFDLYIDGIRQGVTQGNPLIATDFDAHSGDISFGGPGGTLEVGGTNVSFASQQNTNLAYWASWTSYLDDATLLQLFQRGARPSYTITTDTVANMQTQLDALANSTFANDPLTLRIERSSDEVPLNLSADNITFNALSSIHVEYRGDQVLNWTNANGTNLVINKCVQSLGGAITILNPSTLTLTQLQVDTEVRVYETGTQTEVAGVEDSSTTEVFDLFGVTAVDIVLVSLEYKYLKLENIDTSTSTSLPIQQELDRNFLD